MGTDSMALKAPPRQPALWCTKGGSRTGFPPCSLRMAHGGRAPRWERSTSSGEPRRFRSEEHTSELQSQSNLVCRLLLEKKKKQTVCARLQGRNGHYGRRCTSV